MINTLKTKNCHKELFLPAEWKPVLYLNFLITLQNLEQAECLAGERLARSHVESDLILQGKSRCSGHVRRRHCLTRREIPQQGKGKGTKALWSKGNHPHATECSSQPLVKPRLSIRKAGQILHGYFQTWLKEMKLKISQNQKTSSAGIVENSWQRSS